jgi:hypothetical protein
MVLLREWSLKPISTRKESILSEIARLKQQIALECEAMKQAMDGFRVTASHDIINHQYNSIGGLQEQLAAIVGEKEAIQIAVEAYIQAIG